MSTISSRTRTTTSRWSPSDALFRRRVSGLSVRQAQPTGFSRWVEFSALVVPSIHRPGITIFSTTPLRPRFSRRHLSAALSIAAFAAGIGRSRCVGWLGFPASRLMVPFCFRAAFADGTIRQVLRGQGCDAAFLEAELAKLSIGPAPGSDYARGVGGGVTRSRSQRSICPVRGLRSATSTVASAWLA